MDWNISSSDYDFDIWNSYTGINSRWFPINLVCILESTRTRLLGIEAEIQFSENNHPNNFKAAIEEKFEVIWSLPIKVSNILYRMGWNPKKIIGKIIARYAERAEQIEMIWTNREKRDFFKNAHWFWFEIDRLISILSDN